MRWSRLLQCVAVVTAGSLFASTASIASTPSAPEASLATATDIEGLLSQLSASISTLREDPYLSEALDTAGAHPERSIAEALDVIEGFDDELMAVADATLQTTPSLADIPAAIDDGVSAAAEFTPDTVAVAPEGLRRNRSALAGGLAPMVVQSATYTDDCPSAGDPKALAIATLVLNQLQSAAYAAVIAAPSVIGLLPGITAPAAIKQILAVIYGVALGVYLALAQTLAVASDCASASGSEDLALAWPVAGPTSVDPPPGTPVPGSSQSSVDAALVSVGDVTAVLNSVTTNLTLVTGQVATLGERVTALNTTLSCTSGTPAGAPTPTCGSDPGQPPPGSDALSRVTDTQNDLQTVQGDVDVLRNTQHTVLDKANTEIQALSDLQALQIRLEIESNLSDPAFQAVALFQLPSPWGYLDIVADVATEAVANFVGGEADLAAADAAATAGRYKDAYKLYHKAYQGAMK